MSVGALEPAPAGGPPEPSFEVCDAEGPADGACPELRRQRRRAAAASAARPAERRSFLRIVLDALNGMSE
jgi:hypothetical protein